MQDSHARTAILPLISPSGPSGEGDKPPRRRPWVAPVLLKGGGIADDTNKTIYDSSDFHGESSLRGPS